MIAFDTVTLFNRIGDIGGMETYLPTVIRNARAEFETEAGERGSQRRLGAVYIISRFSRADKPYIDYAEWLASDETAKRRYWTVSEGGGDLIARGEPASPLPSGEVYVITGTRVRRLRTGYLYIKLTLGRPAGN